ncbi:PH domain-containing protein [Pseudoglutamicibacter cumminsii]|uniref:PH domain-containing protein n=1 Tax=Pseudoglutamicibacter cumminsii TaxID=156979 RepID=UPI002555106A|nr:PH domain-containing protein [Pseudoglutamicibacter cumminsii]MDZ3744708.1 PH domain-containing protein [Pseudoglutamicibacter cumminsii]
MANVPEEVEWKRVHKATPLVRGWVIVALVAFNFVRSWVESFVSGGSSGGEGEGKGQGKEEGSSGSFDFASEDLLILGASLAVAVGMVVYSWFMWRAMGYRITENRVEVRQGVFMKNVRHARIDRIQSVDINRPILARIFGLAELEFHVADAQEAAAKLQYVTYRQAKQLREDILRAARGEQRAAAAAQAEVAAQAELAAQSEAPAHAPAEPRIGHSTDPHVDVSQVHTERPLVKVRMGRLVAAALMRHVGFGAAVALGYVVTALIDSSFTRPLVVFGPLFLAWAGLVFSMVNTNGGFVVSAGRDGLVLKRGYTESTSTTVPPERVHALGLEQPLLWKLTGWWRVTANVPSDGLAEAKSNVLLPVGTFQEALAVVAALIPNPGTDRTRPLVVAAVDQPSSEPEFVASPRKARWLSPIAGVRQAFAVTQTMLIITSGRLVKRVAFVPHQRTQGVALKQGPLARSAGVATITIGTAAGPVDTEIYDVAEQTAEAFILQQTERAAALAGWADKNHWGEAS